MSVSFSADHSHPSTSYNIYWDTDAGLVGSSNYSSFHMTSDSVFETPNTTSGVWQHSISDSLSDTTIYFGAKAFNRFGESPMSVLTSVLLEST